MLPTDLHPDPSSRTRALAWAIAASLVVHGAVLLWPTQDTPPRTSTSSRFEATLAPAPSAAAVPIPVRPARAAPAAQPRAPAPPTPATRTARPQRAQAKPRATAEPAVKPVVKPEIKPAVEPPPRPPVQTAPNSPAKSVPDAPRWFTPEKPDMNRFLDELATEAKAAPKPSLAQRSLAMARSQGQLQARQDEAGTAMVERVPNASPPNPFSLDFYIDAVVKRLNRSAGFVRNDPRSKGVHLASVHFRINPDGSLKSFKVLNAGDQQAEIAFIKSVVERAIPFAAFPPDIARSARSLGVTICIAPGVGGGFGFSRMSGNRPC